MPSTVDLLAFHGIAPHRFAGVPEVDPLADSAADGVPAGRIMPPAPMALAAALIVPYRVGAAFESLIVSTLQRLRGSADACIERRCLRLAVAARPLAQETRVSPARNHLLGTSCAFPLRKCGLRWPTDLPPSPGRRGSATIHERASWRGFQPRRAGLSARIAAVRDQTVVWKSSLLD